MHLLPENVIKNLITLWIGDFKGIENGDEDYKLQPGVINSIGDACVVAGNTTPAAFGARVPNLATERHYYTAESYTLFATLLGPVLLRNRFLKPKYYKHFLDLVSIFDDCLRMSIDSKYVDTVLRARIVQWVQLYEKYYYKYEPSRLPVCVLTLHAMLHIPDDILNAGPMWCYWNYVTERYVGFIVRSSKSRKNPYASFCRRIRDIAQNAAIKVRYQLQHDLDLSDRRHELQQGRNFAECELFKSDPDISVLKPHVVGTISPQVRTAVKKFALRSFDVSADEAAAFLPEKVSQWGKITFSGGGDTIRAADIVQQSERNMTRDASFLKYSHDVDKNQNHRRMPVELQRKTAYGQLLRIIDLPANLPPAAPRHLLLAVIRPVHVSYYTSNLGTAYYQEGKFKPLEVIDVDDISCLVARVPDHQAGPRRWALRERSDTMGAGEIEEA
ncbi:hypothetical protein K438DRAFT_1567371 [Mycena galopus ATCC 62051]|nr:hypothetical protein K438DRAFT_1648642 [Mycena galopus ATCC 62051]KAF8211913.1 hypothetical protein K438DRAFT_1567371 [Mycena galopus ATCC 62051]